MPTIKKHPGDDGSTGFLGEGCLPKNHARIETLGTLDEASAALGLARALVQNPQAAGWLKDIQGDLYTSMTEVSATPENARKFQTLEQARLEWLNTRVAELETKIHSPHGFILPGDSLAGAALSMARTIVRRAERRLVDLASKKEVNTQILLPYLNRLSLFCFLLELAENESSGHETSLAKEK